MLSVSVVYLNGLKVAHTAECFGLSVSPHFLMDLHVHLSAGGAALAFSWNIFRRWIRCLTTPCQLKDGHFSPPERPGHGILFNKEKLAEYQIV